MREVHIYAETGSRGFKRAMRPVAYLLEARTASGKTATREEFYEEESTYHEAILGAIGNALGRLKESCEVHLHTQDAFVLNMVDGDYLDEWEKADYKNAKGEPVKNADLWEKIAGGMKGHLILTEQGKHSYYNWMISEMERRFGKCS